jgi:spermidine/putrescine transport system ATP-binding protein
MLDVQHIFKSYEGQTILRDISFQVDRGETICLLGASGSGKSTLLRIIAGLEEPDSGTILFNGRDITAVPAYRRDFGLVFQDYALFPHMNVSENVAFGLKMRRLPPEEISERVASSLDLVNLSEFGHRAVTDLSGGEQQRVALARALATRPRLLMFDEPLGALDRTLREELLDELRSILHRTDIPALYITHDQEEAFAIADRILILHDGGIVQAGTPRQIWANPQSTFGAMCCRQKSLPISVRVHGRWRVPSVSIRFAASRITCRQRRFICWYARSWWKNRRTKFMAWSGM